MSILKAERSGGGVGGGGEGILRKREKLWESVACAPKGVVLGDCTLARKRWAYVEFKRILVLEPWAYLCDQHGQISEGSLRYFGLGYSM